MNITFEELRKIKHSLPTGSVKKIANDLQIDEQQVRNFFGAKKADNPNQLVGWHLEAGPRGGILNIEDDHRYILEAAQRILQETAHS